MTVEQTIIRRYWLTILLSLPLFVCSHNALAQSAIEVYRSTVASQSNSVLIQRAQAGDAWAAHQLSLRFSSGKGEIPANLRHSLRWYNRAARRGTRLARNGMGTTVAGIDKLPSIAISRHLDGANTGSALLSEPEVVLALSASTGSAPLTVSFDAGQSSDADGIVLYSWDFGNGESATGVAPTVVFNDPGSYQVTLVVMDGDGTIGRRQATVVVDELVLVPPESPLPLTPQAGDEREQDDVNVRFEWAPVVDAIHYDFEITDSVTGIVTASNSISPAMALCTVTTCRYTASTVDFLSVAPSHLWRVRVHTETGVSLWASSELQIVATATSKPEAPNAVAPADNAELIHGSTFAFAWDRDPAAVGYNFIFQDTGVPGAPVFDFTYDIDPDEWCDAIRCVYPREVNLTVGGTHSWDLHAVNSQGVSQRDRTWFKVIAPTELPPTPPLLMSPNAGAEVLIDATVTFIWNQSNEADSYDFDIADSGADDFAEVVGLDPETICVTGACVFSQSLTLDASLDYEWKVRAVNQYGASTYSVSELQAVVALSNQAPVVSFTPSEVVGTELLTVEFDATASIDDAGIVNYHWDFGDGAILEGGDKAIVSHSFEAGDFTVELTASDAEGLSGTSSIQISVAGNLRPTASFVVPGFARNVSGLAPLSISPDATGSSDDVAVEVYEWDFGDGSDVVLSGNPLGISHVYLTPGDYTLTLTTYDIGGKSDSASINISVSAQAAGVTAQQAARLLTQASFGPRSADISAVQALGIEPWIDQQLLRLGPAHLDYVLQYSNGSNRWPRHEVWWRDVVDGEDQLRQRVAFALSQIFVVSDIGRTLANGQYGVTHFYDQLRQQAFGNYRDLLETVTLSPVMGLYLSMLQNAKADPASNTRADENYAREVLQLFSIGLYNLNSDGSSQGTNTFTQDHIEDFARVFTGWNYKNAETWDKQFFDSPDIISPMEAWPEYHDVGPKTLLNNVTVPAGLSAVDDLTAALDNIFNHPNVGPFISKQLIQKLITSNPSPLYVARVTSVFNDNGDGVRGDLGAVVKAILMDAEARDGFNGAGSHYYGKIREPLLRMSHLWRAFNVERGNNSSSRGEYNTFSPGLETLELDFGQAVLRSPSVFNFYLPDYAPAGPVRSARANLQLNFDLVAPEFEIMTENNQIKTTNRLSRQIQQHFAGSPNAIDRNPSFLDFSAELALAANSDDLLDHLDLLLLNQMMSDELRGILKAHIDLLAIDADGLSQRVRDAVTLIIVSPEYMVQR